MSFSIARIASIVSIAGLLASFTAEPARGESPPARADWQLEAELVPDDPADAHKFGWQVAIAGDFAVVGAPGHGLSGLSLAGAAYVFLRRGGVWDQQARLVAPDAADEDWFGISLAISGDTIVVGAKYDDHSGGVDAGSAYVFVRSGAQWLPQAKLVAPDASDGDLFGEVDIEGDTIVVGAQQDDHGGATDTGSVYVFTRTGTSWTRQAKLVASRVVPKGQFGRCLSLSGDTVVAGGRYAAHVFTRAGNAWSEQAVLLPPTDLPEPAWYGLDLAVSGDTVAVIGRLKSSFARFVVVHVRNGGLWTEQFREGPGSVLEVNEQLALDGDTLALATSHFDGPAGTPGFVDVFTRQAQDWGAPEALNAEYELWFGFAIALEGDAIVAGGFDQSVRVYRR